MKKALSLFIAMLMIISVTSVATIGASAATDVSLTLDAGLILKVNNTEHTLVAKEMTKDNDGYSVKTYAKALYDNAETSAQTKVLLKALLEYGAAAQTYFDYEIGTMANAELGRVTTTPVIPDANKASVTQGTAVTSASATLSLDDTICLVFKFVSNETLTFKVDGNDTDAQKSGDTYTVNIPVYPQNIDKMYTVKASDGTEIGYSVLTFVKNKYASADANLKNLLGTIYDYNQAANAYVGNYVATVTAADGTVTGYTEWSDAVLANAANGSTVTLYDDVATVAETTVANAISLDLNGNILTLGADLTANASLNIKDNAGDNTGAVAGNEVTITGNITDNSGSVKDTVGIVNVLAYNFDTAGNNEGWGANSNYDSAVVSDGKYNLTSKDVGTNARCDHNITKSGLSLNGSDYTKCLVTYKYDWTSTTVGHWGATLFAFDDTNTLIEPAPTATPATISSGEYYVTIEFDLSALAGKTISKIRLDISEATGTASIDSIVFTNGEIQKTNILAYNFNVAGNNEGWGNNANWASASVANGTYNLTSKDVGTNARCDHNITKSGLSLNGSDYTKCLVTYKYDWTSTTVGHWGATLFAFDDTNTLIEPAPTATPATISSGEYYVTIEFDLSALAGKTISKIRLDISEATGTASIDSIVFTNAETQTPENVVSYNFNMAGYTEGWTAKNSTATVADGALHLVAGNVATDTTRIDHNISLAMTSSSWNYNTCIIKFKYSYSTTLTSGASWTTTLFGFKAANNYTDMKTVTYTPDVASSSEYVTVELDLSDWIGFNVGYGVRLDISESACDVYIDSIVFLNK